MIFLRVDASVPNKHLNWALSCRDLFIQYFILFDPIYIYLAEFATKLLP